MHSDFQRFRRWVWFNAARFFRYIRRIFSLSIIKHEATAVRHRLLGISTVRWRLVCYMIFAWSVKRWYLKGAGAPGGACACVCVVAGLTPFPLGLPSVRNCLKTCRFHAVDTLECRFSKVRSIVIRAASHVIFRNQNLTYQYGLKFVLKPECY